MVMRTSQTRRAAATNAGAVSSTVLARVRRHVSNAMETVRWLVAVALTARDTAPLPPRHLSLASLAASAILDRAWLARARRQRLVCVAYGDCRVRADPERVRWILDNLLTIATESSPPGAHIHVVVATRQVGGRTWCTATVADQSSTLAHASRVSRTHCRHNVLAPEYGATGTSAPLSANRHVARLLDGELTIDPPTACAGMSVTLWLPPDGATASS